MSKKNKPADMRILYREKYLQYLKDTKNWDKEEKILMSGFEVRIGEDMCPDYSFQEDVSRVTKYTRSVKSGLVMAIKSDQRRGESKADLWAAIAKISEGEDYKKYIVFACTCVDECLSKADIGPFSSSVSELIGFNERRKEVLRRLNRYVSKKFTDFPTDDIEDISEETESVKAVDMHFVTYRPLGQTVIGTLDGIARPRIYGRYDPQTSTNTVLYRDVFSDASSQHLNELRLLKERKNAWRRQSVLEKILIEKDKMIMKYSRKASEKPSVVNKLIDFCRLIFIVVFIGIFIVVVLLIILAWWNGYIFPQTDQSDGRSEL